MVLDPVERWSTEHAGDLYDVASWGKGYFSVDRDGHVHVHPTKDPARSIDLKKLVDTLVLRGISLPVLIRFADILKHRLGEIHDAFAMAIAEHRYQAGYCCVYPIKVNQQRQVIEEVLEFGRPYKFGVQNYQDFGYFKVAYGLDFIAPQGVSTESEASAKEVAKIITQVNGRAVTTPAEYYVEMAKATGRAHLTILDSEGRPERVPIDLK